MKRPFALRRSYPPKGGDATALLLLLWSIGITSYVYDSITYYPSKEVNCQIIR